VQFLRAVDDVEIWIQDMCSQLASEDTGRDLISVNSLLKRHEVHGFRSVFVHAHEYRFVMFIDLHVHVHLHVHKCTCMYFYIG